jgi:hypothetical protein
VLRKTVPGFQRRVRLPRLPRGRRDDARHPPVPGPILRHLRRRSFRISQLQVVPRHGTDVIKLFRRLKTRFHGRSLARCGDVIFPSLLALANRNDPISVTLSKVAKASKEGDIADVFAYKLRPCK